MPVYIFGAGVSVGWISIGMGFSVYRPGAHEGWVPHSTMWCFSGLALPTQILINEWAWSDSQSYLKRGLGMLVQHGQS